MRRELITWSVALAVILAAFAGTVLILNATLYSASGFVRSYLDALARHDAAGARELAGPSVAGDASRELLVPAAMGELGDIRLLSDTLSSTGLRRIAYAYTSGGVAGQIEFEVRRRGTLFGLFSTWEFQTSPLGVIRLTVQHGDTFAANGLNLIAAAPNRSAPYLAFTPGTYEFSHDSTFLHADPVRIAATQPGAAVAARLDLQANSRFVAQVQKEVNGFLDTCATQRVLLPTGCPFGQPMGNRIVTTPAWSITTYPKVSLSAGTAVGQWVMPTTDATARLLVDVKSLFDGSVSRFNEDVPFSMGSLVSVLPGNQVLVTVQ